MVLPEDTYNSRPRYLLCKGTCLRYLLTWGCHGLWLSVALGRKGASGRTITKQKILKIKEKKR